MSSHCHDHDSKNFHHHQGSRSQRPGSSSPTNVHPRHQADKNSGCASQNEVNQQQSFQLLSRQLPLPGSNASRERGQNKNRRCDKVKIGRCRQHRFPLNAFCPARRKIESDARQKQRNRKVNQDDMLRVFRQQRRFEIEGIHEPALLHHQFARHLGVNRTEIRVTARLGWGKGERVIGVEHFRLETPILADHGMRNVIRVSPRDLRSRFHGQDWRSETEVINPDVSGWRTRKRWTSPPPTVPLKPASWSLPHTESICFLSFSLLAPCEIDDCFSRVSLTNYSSVESISARGPCLRT